MLGKRVMELRARCGLTQAQVVLQMAHRCGVEIPRAYLSRIERGGIKLPGPEIVHALADVLGTTEHDLMAAAGYLRSIHAGNSSLDPEVTRRMDRLSDYAPWVQEVLLSQLDTGMDVLDRQFGSDMQRTLCQMAAQIGPEETDLIQRLEEITLAHESHQRRGNESNDAQLRPGEAEPVPVQDAVHTEGDL